MEIRIEENKWKFLWKRINLTDAKCDGGHEMNFFYISSKRTKNVWRDEATCVMYD